MAEMVRKQFYIHRRHDQLLKRIAQSRGVSEAEVVRQAIEHEAAGSMVRSQPPDHQAWNDFLGFIEQRKALDNLGPAYQWRRADAYEERESRWDGPTTPEETE